MKVDQGNSSESRFRAQVSESNHLAIYSDAKQSQSNSPRSSSLVGG